MIIQLKSKKQISVVWAAASVQRDSWDLNLNAVSLGLAQSLPALRFVVSHITECVDRT